jgi:hypothetical protein
MILHQLLLLTNVSDSSNESDEILTGHTAHFRGDQGNVPQLFFLPTINFIRFAGFRTVFLRKEVCAIVVGPKTWISLLICVREMP